MRVGFPAGYKIAVMHWRFDDQQTGLTDV